MKSGGEEEGGRRWEEGEKGKGARSKERQAEGRMEEEGKEVGGPQLRRCMVLGKSQVCLLCL